MSKSERRMELVAALNGLKQLRYPCRVNLFTGTEYVSSCARELIRGRRFSPLLAAIRSGTAKNADLWREFESLAKTHRITVVWVAIRSRHAADSTARFAALWAT